MHPELVRALRTGWVEEAGRARTAFGGLPRGVWMAPAPSRTGPIALVLMVDGSAKLCADRAPALAALDSARAVRIYRGPRAARLFGLRAIGGVALITVDEMPLSC